MLYNEAQIKAISTDLQKKYLAGECESHELVVALISMEAAGKINTDDIKDILIYVFCQNVKVVINALKKVKLLIDVKMIDSILNDVQEVK